VGLGKGKAEGFSAGALLLEGKGTGPAIYYPTKRVNKPTINKVRARCTINGSPAVKPESTREAQGWLLRASGSGPKSLLATPCKPSRLSEGRARCDGKVRPTKCGIRGALGHELVHVMVVAIVQAADVTSLPVPYANSGGFGNPKFGGGGRGPLWPRSRRALPDAWLRRLRYCHIPTHATMPSQAFVLVRRVRPVPSTRTTYTSVSREGPEGGAISTNAICLPSGEKKGPPGSMTL
jgi:hypothetical protein